MTPDEYEASFHGIDLPQSIHLFPGSFIPDVPGYIKQQIEILRVNTAPRIQAPIEYRLGVLLQLIQEKNNG
ncbi:DUF6965 family protein [Pedobacter sp. PWIIR3]